MLFLYNQTDRLTDRQQANCALFFKYGNNSVLCGISVSAGCAFCCL